MIDPEIVRSLLTENESPILEFKREWYWLENVEGEDLGPKWGEFAKDILGLCNGYLDFVGQDRYLIIGYCETEKKIFHVNSGGITVLQDLRAFRKNVIARLEKLASPPPLNLEVEFVTLDEQLLLVFKISSPKSITELKAELTTKTRTLDPGAVLVRKGQDCDSIRLATLQEISSLSGEFEKFKNSISAQNTPISQQKERSIAKTVQLYIEKNSSFSIDVGFPVSHRDYSENIIFELFRISEELGSSKYFLYIHENATQGKTQGYIKKNNLIDDKHTLIILTERPEIKDIEKRKENLAHAFKAKHVFFIDEFGLNYLYGDFIHEFESYNLPIFVESFTTELVGNDNSALRILKNWYNAVATPLMVIKGYGGIGKSTLAKQFLDEIGKDKNGIGLLFIDSNEVIDRLSKATRAGKKIDDLYDFYLAQFQGDETETKNFSKDLLKLSIDNGSLVIVLDGIDEVIAKLGSKFDITCFVKSILNSYSSNLERGKILITCRDNFWRELDDKDSIQEITLMPFNVNLAREFFNQSFSNNNGQIERAMGMADKFALKKMAGQGEESIYIPYVLDMIAYLIKHKQAFGDKEIKFATTTKILNPKNISNDFLVGSVCEREITKLGNYGIDDQINFFINFSASASEHVSLYDVKGIFEEATTLQVSDEFVEKLTGHPLLSRTGNTLNFRYDFFYQYFKSLYVARYFYNKSIANLTPNLIDIFGTYVGFDNEFSRSLCARFAYDEEIVLFAIESIEKLKEKIQSANSIEQGRLRSAISGIFVLLLSLHRELTPSLDTATCTKLLKDIFYSKNSLDGICLVSVFGSDRARPIFDFRDIVIENSHFEQYEHFWDCPINAQTKFNSSTFVALDPRVGVKPQIFPGIFDANCDITDISEIINHRTKEVEDGTTELKKKLYQFFKLFYKQGNLYPKKQEDVRARVNTGNLLQTLIKNKVVVDYVDPRKAAMKQYKVTDEYRQIYKIFEQGGSSFEFDRVVDMFTK